MKATLRVQGRGNIEADVAPSTTVAELKDEVQNKCMFPERLVATGSHDTVNIAPLQQLFIAMGSVLADGDTINEHFATERGVVQVFVDPAGFSHLDPSVRCQPKAMKTNSLAVNVSGQSQPRH